MVAPAILAIDQGTTNTKALLVSPDGTILARASRPMTLSHPQPGWAEQSATDIWHSVVGVIADLVADPAGTGIAAVAISNQRETVLIWDAVTGKPLGPAISWQCRRSSGRCAALRDAGHESAVVERTGLTLDPMFPAAKLAWLLDSIPDGRDRARAGTLRAGTVDSWLVWNLTGGTVHATDHGNASRTQLFDLHAQGWSEDLLTLFDVPSAALPQIRPSDSRFGETAAGRTALPAGVPIHAVMGDSHAALFGHDLSEPGAAKVTMGTGSSIMALTAGPVRSRNGLSTTVAWSQGDTLAYALEGNILVSGQAAAFAARLLGLADESALTSLAQTVDDSGGIVFVPALAGLGAPHWLDRARGMIAGMTLATRPAHVARATLEAIAMQIVDVAKAMEADIGMRLPVVSVDGGATRNDLLMQLLCDLLDRPVTRRPDAEISALGAARMAALAIGLDRPRGDHAGMRRFEATMGTEERERILRGWHTAVDQATPAPHASGSSASTPGQAQAQRSRGASTSPVRLAC